MDIYLGISIIEMYEFELGKVCVREELKDFGEAVREHGVWWSA